MSSKNKQKVATAATVIALTLEQLAAFGADGTFAHPAEIAGFAGSNLIEVNEAIKDSEGRLAVRISQAGIDSLSVKDSEFVIEDGVPMPEVSRGRGASSFKWPYPFPALAVGQSFAVAVDSPDKVKTLKSTVANANRRYSKEDPSGATKVVKGKTVPVKIAERTFFGREVTENGEKKFRIWRKA